MATNERKIKGTGPHIPQRGGRSVSAPGAAGRSVSEYNVTGPYIPNRGERFARARERMRLSSGEYTLAMPYIPKHEWNHSESVGEYTLAMPYIPPPEGPFEYTLAMPYIPNRGGRIASNYNLVGTQRRGNASYRPNKRDVLGNSGSREF